MADLYMIIQKIMRYQKCNTNVDVILKNCETYTGTIAKFNGQVEP